MKTITKILPILILLAIAVLVVAPSYATEESALKADLKVGSSQGTGSWLERAEANSRIATMENPLVAYDGETLLLYFGGSVGKAPLSPWYFDLDGDDGVFSLPLLGVADPWLWVIAEYDYYYNRTGTVKNADGSITVPLAMRIENGENFSEDRVFIKILP